jgi:hypothetical protein
MEIVPEATAAVQLPPAILVRIEFDPDGGRAAVNKILNQIGFRFQQGQYREEHGGAIVVALSAEQADAADRMHREHARCEITAANANVPSVPLADRQWQLLELALNGIADDSRDARDLATRGEYDGIYFAWDGVIGCNTLNLFAAPSKAGKTTWLRQFLKAGHTSWDTNGNADTMFLGRRVGAFHALVASEEPPLAWGDPAPGTRVMFAKGKPLVGAEWTAWVENLGALACEYDLDLVVIDTISRFWGGDENSARAVTRAFAPLRGLLRLDRTVLVVHHANAAGNVRGSGAFAAQSDAVLTLDRVSDDKLDPRRVLTVEPRLVPLTRVEYAMTKAGTLEVPAAVAGPSRNGSLMRGS